MPLVFLFLCSLMAAEAPHYDVSRFTGTCTPFRVETTGVVALIFVGTIMTPPGEVIEHKVFVLQEGKKVLEACWPDKAGKFSSRPVILGITKEYSEAPVVFYWPIPWTVEAQKIELQTELGLVTITMGKSQTITR